VDIAAGVVADFDLTRGLSGQVADVVRHRAGLGLRHHARGASTLTQAPTKRNHVRRGDGDIKIGEVSPSRSEPPAPARGLDRTGVERAWSPGIGAETQPRGLALADAHAQGH